MCNLYTLHKGQAAIRDLVKVWEDRTGNLAPLPGIFPDMSAPIIRNGEGGPQMVMARWGMPSPMFALKNRRTDTGVTNIRNITSPHWRRWLGVEHRCLVPFTSFSEYDGNPPEPVWFALSEDRPVAFFAGLWTRWTSVRKLKEGETTNDLYGFLTTEPNAVVAPTHPKAMPVILTEPSEWATWLSAPVSEATELQRPLADEALKIVARGEKRDPPFDMI